MDALLCRRLTQSSTLYDSELYNRLARLARDYVKAGTSVLNYYIPDFDTQSDLLNCYARAPQQDLEKRDRSDPDNFIHPMTATEVWTLATFISQILFGGETTRRVEPRQPDDEPKADVINEVLQWNDQQQDTYGQGFHWCLDAISHNRGIMYDRWKDLFEVVLEPVEYELPWEPPIDPETGKRAKDESGKTIRKPRNYEPEKKIRFRKKRKKVGGFVKIDLISPFDFVTDPTMPPPRFQESRFAGHRVWIPWLELERRSKLDSGDYEYVLPEPVAKLKNAKPHRSPTPTMTSNASMSRSYFERTRRQQPLVGTLGTGTDKINKEDGGVVECFSIQIRARPKVYDIFDDEEEELIELLIAGELDLLSVNVMTNKHDQYPYAVGEGRPNAHFQFSPSWSLIIKGPQDYADYLKNRHHESLSRTSGNIFLAIAEYVDFEAFTNPKKDGLIIPLTPAGVDSGKTLDQILKQIPVVDTTANFHEEMLMWQRCAEETTGAHSPVQGGETEGDPTATQFVGTQQMAQGRISTIARLLSARALVPQTQRIMQNLQQFLPDTMVIRITGTADFDPERPQEKFTTVIRDTAALEDGTGIDEETREPIARDPLLDQQDWKGRPLPDIQGSFDVVPHDGALPGTDAAKVAAMSRALEVFSTNPMLAPVFDVTKPGAFDPIKLAQKMFKATGLPTAGILVTADQAKKNAQAQMMAMGGGMGMPPAAPPAAPGAVPPIATPPPMPTPTGPIPGAAEVPPIPSAQPPGPNAGNTLGALPA